MNTMRFISIWRSLTGDAHLKDTGTGIPPPAARFGLSDAPSVTACFGAVGFDTIALTEPTGTQG